MVSLCRSSAIALICALVGVAAPVPCSADSTGARWVAPPGCAAPPAFGPADADAVVTRVEGGYRVDLRVRQDGIAARRTFVAATCAQAAEGVATVLALSATSLRVSAPPATATATAAPTSAPTSTPTSTPTPTPTPTPTATSTSTSTPTSTSPATVTAPATGTAPLTSERARAIGSSAPPRGRPRIALGVLVAGDAGALPGGDLGVGALGAIESTHLRFELGADAWLPRSAELDGTPGVGGRFSLVTSAARACFAAPVHPLRAAVCLGASVGYEHAEGYGATHTNDGSGWLAGPTAALVALVPVSARLALRAAGEGEAALVRPRFVIVDGGPVHGVGPLHARAELGPEVSF